MRQKPVGKSIQHYIFQSSMSERGCLLANNHRPKSLKLYHLTFAEPLVMEKKNLQRRDSVGETSFDCKLSITVVAKPVRT